jgi:glycerol dehydrogenase-like iron-containing ADH family enzyme
MATLVELQALVAKLPDESADLDAKTSASHDALANVTTVTDVEQAAVDAATAHQTQAVAAAQASADEAVQATEDSKKALDDNIDAIIAAAQSLKV